MSDIEKSEWYEALVEECKAIITEAVFTSRWALVEGYHGLGERIVSDANFKKHAKGNESSLTDLSRKIGVGARDVYRAVQFYEKFPSLATLPGGKNMTWNKVIALLPVPKPPAPIVAIPGKYNVIAMDPPWPYGTEYDATGRRAASPYQEMPLSELVSLPIPAADDCLLWLWTTHAFMREAFPLLDAWGFRDVAILTWAKDRMGLGQWLRSQSEFCIMAVKGKPRILLSNQTTVLNAPVREHSRKPDEFYAFAESLVPTEYTKLDCFSREKRSGWDQYGNEPDKF